MPAMTLNLPDSEMEALDELALRDATNKTAIIRQALKRDRLLRAYVDLRCKFFVQSEDGERMELLVIF